MALTEKLKSQKKAHITATNGDSLINVNRITEKAGALYEKVRYLVDYKDERHIRRSAIERIAKRKIVFEGGNDAIGMSLVQELIAGRYLANNSIPEKAIEELNTIVSKYITLVQSLPEGLPKMPKYRNAILSIMSSEIESFFFSGNEDDFVADAFFATVADDVRVSDLQFSQSEVPTQVNIACYRSLLNSDDEALRYKLWNKHNPTWVGQTDIAQIQNIGPTCPNILDSIQASLENPLSLKLIPKLNNHAIYFSIIRELVHAYGAESERVISDPEMRERFIKDYLEKNYKHQFSKARSSAVRAVLYIFCTKIVIALAMEVPYQIYVIKEIEYIPIATNVLVHPIVLMFMTLTVGKLGDENTKKILQGVEKIITSESGKLIRIPPITVSIFTVLFYCLYVFLFMIVFGVIIVSLFKFNFSIVSIFLFLCFLALISYFALRIRHSANKWKVTQENDKIFGIMFNLFALPIIKTGKWLSRKFSSINLFVFILDFIIETPFKFVLNFSDAFVSFLKEKQDDVY